MHSSISPAAALHAQGLSALLPYLAQHFLQDTLNCGHLFLGALLQLEAPETHNKLLHQLWAVTSTELYRASICLEYAKAAI